MAQGIRDAPAAGCCRTEDLLVFYWGTRGGVSHTRWARLKV